MYVQVIVILLHCLYFVGFIADFTCAEGWLLGVSRMECGTGGVWRLTDEAGPAIFPTCSLMTCSFIPDSTTTYLMNTSDTLFPVYTQINVSCKPGNTFPVTNEVSTMLVCSTNGWTPVPANCTTAINPSLLPYSATTWAIAGSAIALIWLLLAIFIAILLVVLYFNRRKKRLRISGILVYCIEFIN